jgi:cytochrome c556
MRAVAMLAVGVVLGALGAVTAVGAMKQEVPFPKVSMTMMRHHFQPLRDMAAGPQCNAATVQRHLRGLQALSSEFDAFLPTGGDDAAFKRHAAEFARTMDAAMAAPPATCQALGETTRQIGGACKACHDEFRG